MRFDAGRLIRGAFAVAAGYIVFAMAAVMLFNMTGHEPHAPASATFMVLSTLCGMIFAALGGYLAALIAGRAAPGAPAVLCGIIALGAALSAVMVPAGGVIWSQVVAAVLMAPSAIGGGFLRRRQLDRPPTT